MVYGKVNWIRLTDRRQTVIVEGDISNWKPVLSGVPQWSVLFIFINDLDDDLSSKVHCT